MRSILVFALLLLTAPMAHAQVQATAPVAPAVQAPAIPERSAPFEVAEPVRFEERQLLVENDDAAAALQPDRTSWWWIVVAVIVAGVVLAAAGVF